jgi:hypothetical protein
VGAHGVTATARLGELELPAVVEDSADGRVAIIISLEGELLPGEHVLSLQVSLGEDRVLVRRPFPVWYADDSLTVQLLQAQESVERSVLAHGTTLRFRAKVFDAQGKEMLGVPASAMRLEGEGITTRSLAAKYESESYIVVATIDGSVGAGVRELSLSVDHLGRRGSASSPLTVLDQAPLALSILDIDPGKKDRPILYILLSGLGFDLDVYLNVGGVEHVTKENAQVTINGRDVTRLMAYAVNTNKGVRMHLSGVSLCPDVPPQGAKLLVEVSLGRGSERVSDSAVLYTRGNPGDWSNMGVSGCA